MVHIKSYTISTIAQSLQVGWQYPYSKANQDILKV